MRKPHKKFPIEALYNYNEIINYIEKKYNINTREYGRDPNESHFEKYQRITGDKAIVSPIYHKDHYQIYRDRKYITSTKEKYDEDFKFIYDQYKRYQEWCKKNPEPPYLDYWHWLLENSFYSPQNGTKETIYVKEILDNDNPEWVKQITQMIYDEFSEDLNDDGSLNVWIEW